MAASVVDKVGHRNAASPRPEGPGADVGASLKRTLLAVMTR